MQISYEELFRIWENLDKQINYLDDLMNECEMSPQDLKRLSYTRDHLSRASLSIFPIAFNGLYKNA